MINTQYMNPMLTQRPYSPYPYNMDMASSTLIRVTGVDGAKAYQMNANSTVALFDNNEDLFYIKTTDGAGFPTIRTFKFSEILDVNKSTVGGGDFVSRQEFENFKKEMMEYGQQFISQSTNIKKSNASDKSKSDTND